MGETDNPADDLADDTVLLPRARATGRVSNWWGRAFARSVEECAYAESDVRASRRLARSPALGTVMVLPGMVSGVAGGSGEERVIAQVKVHKLVPEDWADFRAELRRETGFLADLETGRLSPALIEASDELGVELFPSVGDFEFACECEPWVDPCQHALAVLHRVTWALDVDPYLLLLLRGRGRGWLTEVPAVEVAFPDHGMETEVDLAAAAAAALLAELEE